MNQPLPLSQDPAGSGGDTRAALIAVARRAFAEQGYDGASIRRITSEAGANLGAVTYHFGSKRHLYAEVLRTVLAPLLERVRDTARGPGPGLERVLGVVRAFFAHLQANPDQPGLMLQEIASGRVPPDPAPEIIRSVFGTVTGLIREGQSDGSIRAGDPPLLTLSTVAQPIYVSLARRLITPVLDLDGSLRAGVEARFVDHAVDFVRRGLAAGEGTSP